MTNAYVTSIGHVIEPGCLHGAVFGHAHDVRHLEDARERLRSNKGIK